MKHRLLRIASTAVISGMVANAAVTSVGPAIEAPGGVGPDIGGLFLGPWSLELPFTVDLTMAGTTVPWFSTFWSVTVTDSMLGPFHVVTIEGQHLDGPQGQGPSGLASLGVLFIASVPGGGEAYGVVPHHIPPPGGDDWLLTLSVDPGGTTASGTVFAWHKQPVPEPASLGALAGLGLVGFAAMRRKRA